MRLWLTGHSMESKLMLVFTAAIIAASIPTYALLYFAVSQNYQKQLLFSANQSFEQSYQFLKNRLDALSTSADAIYYNEEVPKNLMQLADSKYQKDISFQYREMYAIQNILYSYSTCQQNDLRISLYVPDDLVFSKQNDYFFSLDSLKQDKKILAQPGHNLWLAPETIPFSSDVSEKKRISLLRKISSTGNVTDTVGLLRVSMPASVFENILANSNITRQGAVMIFDEKKNILVSSNQAVLKKMGLGSGGKNWSLLDAPHSWDELSLGGENYYIKLATLENTGWKFVALIPSGELLWQIQRNSRILFFVLSFLIIAVCIFSYRFSRRFTLRIRHLSRQMEIVDGGNLNGKIENHDVDEIGRLTDHFNDMLERLRNYQQEVFEKGKALKSAELNALQSQINPHFLYNTLDLINWEAMESDAPEIAEISCSLARFYKLSLNRGKDMTPIEDEVEHASLYVNIQNLRYDSRIHLNIDMPKPILQAVIPKIVLQPLVENSIQHGLLENMDDKVLEISMKGKVEPNSITERGDILIIIRDDGVGMTSEQLANILSSDADISHGYGVQNVHRRLQLCYGKDYGLSYQSTLGQGTTVMIRIPFLLK